MTYIAEHSALGGELGVVRNHEMAGYAHLSGNDAALSYLGGSCDSGQRAHHRVLPYLHVVGYLAEIVDLDSPAYDRRTHLGLVNGGIGAYLDVVADYHVAAVFFASNGEDGLHKIRIAAPDLIITDGVLPVMDGYQLCEGVRAQAATCHIPIVMVSSDSSVRGRMKGFQAGADAYLLKPFRADELLMRVSLLLQQRRMLRDKYAGSVPVVNDADGQAETTDRTPDFIDEVQQYVDSRIGEGDVDLADLAARFGVTRATFTRKVKQHTGLTSAAYITSRRIRLSGRSRADCAGGRRRLLRFHKAEAEKAGRIGSWIRRCEPFSPLR